MITTAKFLKEQKVLRLTTIGPDGVPHTVPVWYLYRSKKILIGTNTKTVKARNLRKNNKVAFCVDIGVNSPDIYGVAGSGTARLVEQKGRVSKIATDILLRYFASMREKSAQELLDETDCIIEIAPDRITKWHY